MNNKNNINTNQNNQNLNQSVVQSFSDNIQQNDQLNAENNSVNYSTQLTNNDTNKSKSIIFVVLIILGLIIGGYFLFFKDKKPTPKPNNNNSEPTSLFNKDLSLSPQILFDNEFLKYEITKFEVDTKHEKYVIHVKYTNKLNEPVEITNNIMYVNNIKRQIIPGNTNLLVEVGANQVYETFFEVSTNRINQDIEFITDIESLTFQVYTSIPNGTSKKLYKDVSFQGSKIKQNYNIGENIYSDEKIDVNYVSLVKDTDHSSEDSKNLNILIHNKSNENVYLWPTDFYIYINGEKVTGSMNTDTLPGKYSIDTLWFSYPGEIDSINKVGFGLTYFKHDSNLSPYKDSYTSFIEFDTKK